MARLCRAHDWAATPLGDPQGWPLSLVAMVRLLLSAHHPMLLTWGPAQTQIFNDAFLPIVGGGPRLAAALGADARVFWGPTWAAAVPRIEAVQRGGAPTVVEDQPLQLERDGRLDEAFMSFSMSPVLDDTGATAGVVILAFETTAAVHARAAAAERERSLRVITEMARLGGWVVELDLGVCHWSDEVCDLHGVPRGTTIPASDGVRWFAPEHQELVRSAFERLLHDGTPYTLEVQIVTASGGRRWVRTTGERVSDAEGRPQLVRGILQDIEEEYVAWSRVREQAELLDRATDAIIVHDMVGTVLYWNAGAERIFGWRAEELVGRSAASIGYEDAAVVGGAVERAIEAGSWAGELPMHRRDGTPMVLDSRWTVLRDAQGVPHRIMTIGTDVTERNALLQQFLRAQRMESIGALAGGIAHDLNNVLAPILMALDLLREDATSPETLDLLDTLRTSAERGAGMVRQILTFARGVEGEKHPVDLRVIVRDVHRVARDTFPKSIRFVNAVSEGLWVVNGNATQFHQVLMNLVVNARDALPHGGSITVSAENIEIDEQYAAMSPDVSPGPYVRLVVSDDGTGMPPEVLSRIYEPFFTTKPVGQGTGLGIPTTLSIVRGHGGFMTVYSDVGRGTTFRLYFPAMTAERSVAVPDLAAPVPRGTGETILLVDDDHAVREVAAATLQAHGYTVVSATDGADAVAQFARMGARIALVVTDLTMPVMDGATTMRAIRGLDATVPFVAMSGLADPGSRHLPSDIAVHRVLQKPFTASMLLLAVYECRRDIVPILAL
jgi:PAS domain S-box-containing protein